VRLGTLPGGTFLPGRLIGEAPGLYEGIGPGTTQLEAAAEATQATQPHEGGARCIALKAVGPSSTGLNPGGER